MFGRVCPFCRERVKKEAVVCRFCHRDLEPVTSSDVSTVGFFAAFFGLAVGVGAMLLLGYRRERRRWEDAGCYPQMMPRRMPRNEGAGRRD